MLPRKSEKYFLKFEKKTAVNPFTFQNSKTCFKVEETRASRVVFDFTEGLRFLNTGRVGREVLKNRNRFAKA